MTKKSILLALGALATCAAVVGWLGYRALTTRRVAQETDRLARVLHLKPTSRVADVGAGSGAFTMELASHVVPQGHVFATEIDDGSLRALEREAARMGAGRVTVVRAREDSANLPASCCDAAFLRGVYHHIGRPAETAASLRASLQPGARLAIIDFEPSWFLSTFFPVRDVPANRGGHGVPPAVVIAELERAGFTLAERHDDWTSGQYCLVFQ